MLIDWEYIQSKLNLADSQQEEYENLIDEAVSIAEGFCKRDLSPKDHVEVLDGEESNTLILANYPVNSIAVNYDTEREFTEDTVLDPATYMVDKSSGIIKLYGGVFPESISTIKVEYNAGYNPVPPQLKEALLEIVQWLRGRFSNYGGGIGLSDLDGGGFSAKTEMLIPINAKVILERFKK